MPMSAEIERQRVTCTSDDHVVEQWEVHQGYVHVDGVRVLGGDGSRGVPVVTTIDMVCCSCAARTGNGHYVTPAVLWGRYEHALGRPMYWFAAALPCPRHDCETTQTKCNWCDAPINTENSLSELCEDCAEADSKQIEQDEARERAYWRHVDQKIDEARGK